MKRILLTFLLGAAGVRAQITLEWSTSDGGGGASAGGSYTLNGTIAQTDASAPATDGLPGGFSLEGGYWTFPDLSAPAPEMTMVFDGGFVALAWPDPGFAVVLESSDDLDLWAPVDPQPEINAWAEPEQQRRFYRLRRMEP